MMTGSYEPLFVILSVVFGTLVILALATVGWVIDRTMQSKIAFTTQLSAQSILLAQQFDESQRLTAKLEEMNGQLQRSHAEAHQSRRALTEQHAKNLELQRAAALEAVKAHWLEGIADTATTVAHEINNPLTSLIIHAEMLEGVDPDQALDSIAEIRRAARRIALVVRHRQPRFRGQLRTQRSMTIQPKKTRSRTAGMQTPNCPAVHPLRAQETQAI